MPPRVGKDKVIENRCKSLEIKPNNYQVMLSGILDPNIGRGNGLLAYHDVGTGKTCTALLFIQTYYLSLLSEKESEQLNPNKTNTLKLTLKQEKLIPSALVLVPSTAIMNNFKNDFVRGCYHPEIKALGIKFEDYVAERNMSVNTTTKEWMMLNYKTKLPVLRVVIHVMQNNLEKRYHRMWSETAADADSSEDISLDEMENTDTSTDLGSVIPLNGVVIVDEAHNLINSTEVLTSITGKRRVLDYARKLSKTNIPILLMTATPIINQNNFLDLLLLLDLIRDKTAPKLSDGIYEYEKDEKYDARNNKAVKEWMKFNPDNNTYEWLPKKEKEFYTLISGYVSFMTLKNDPRVYPRIAELELVTVPYSFMRFDKTGELRKDKELKDTDKNPTKWDMIKERLYPHQKHFIFSPKSYYYTLKTGLEYLFKDYELLDLKIDYSDPKYITPEYIQSYFTNNDPKLRYVFLGKSNSLEDPKYVKDRNDVLLRIFNHPLNDAGKYLHVVVGNIFVKEGVNLMSLPNIHILQPPPSKTMLDQAIGRALRFCSFKSYSNDPNDWNIKLTVYISSEGEREAYEALHIKNYLYNKANSDYVDLNEYPTDLALTALRKGAVDCLLYQNLTGVTKCYSPMSPNGINQFDLMRGVCINPLDNSLIVVPQVGINDFSTYCSNNLKGVPAGSHLYTEEDAALYLYLLKMGYKPVGMSDLADLVELNKNIRTGKVHINKKAKWNEKLITRIGNFGRFLSSKTGLLNLVLKWSSSHDKPYLFISLPPKNNIKHIIEHINNSHPKVGNSIMYLLEHKRTLSSKEIIDELDKKVAVKSELADLLDQYMYNSQLSYKSMLEFKKNVKHKMKDYKKSLKKFNSITNVDQLYEPIDFDFKYEIDNDCTITGSCKHPQSFNQHQEIDTKQSQQINYGRVKTPKKTNVVTTEQTDENTTKKQQKINKEQENEKKNAKK